MSNQEPTHRATKSNFLRNNPYAQAQAKLTFVDVDDASPYSVDDAGASPSEKKLKARGASVWSAP